MTLPIITADQRLAEPRGIKGCIFGKSGLGKTSLLWTLDASTTLFFDLEAGDLAIEGWQGDAIRPRTWKECRDFAVFIGGPNPALREDQSYSQAHYDGVCERFGDHLVPPRTFIIDVGVQDELNAVRRTMSDFDMTEVAGVMDRAPVTDEVIRHWKEKAGDRKTVVFCSTVEHARNVTEAFVAAGVSAHLVHGDMPADERRAALAAYAAGRVRVVVNVGVLTEGWDHPPTSCVVLLRPSSFKSTMIQMVGWGLRTVTPEEHPGVVKTDCIVLDFGTASLTHGTLEQDVDLVGHEATGEAPTRVCPG
jgi:hypothetical protein